MKPVSETEEIITNNQNQEIPISLLPGDIAAKMLIDFLSDLYPQPRKTICTEFVQNALDSHKRANKSDVPIDIYLPNERFPYYVIRDYGVSMDDDTVKTTFSRALDSTKRDSDDYIGGYGVGRLCFAPYSGLMFFTTFINGYKTVWQFRLKGGKGGITEISKTKSDEPQGVEVKIPIKSEDFTYFNNQIKFTYCFLKTKPNVKNVQGFSYSDNKVLLSKESEYEIYSERFENQSSRPFATIGGLPFPIDTHAIGGNVPDLPIVLHFKVGEIDHTPSRDSIKYNEKSTNAILNKLNMVVEDVQEYISNKSKEFKNIYEANCFVSKIYNGSNTLTQFVRRYNIQQNITFNGIKIRGSIGRDTSEQFLSCYIYIVDYYNKLKTHPRYVHDVPITEKEKYIFVPFGFSKHKVSRRIKKYLVETGSATNQYVLFLRENQTIKNFQDKEYIPDDQCINIEDLQDPLKSRSKTNRTNTTPKSKSGNYFKYRADVDRFYETSQECLDKEQQKIYVPIKFFKAFHNDSSIEISSLVKYIVKAIDPNFILYGVKQKEVSKLDSTWTCLPDYVEKILNNYKAKIDKNIRYYSNLAKFYVGYHSDNLSELSNIKECKIFNHLSNTFKRYEKYANDINLVIVYNNIVRFFSDWVSNNKFDVILFDSLCNNTNKLKKIDTNMYHIYKEYKTVFRSYYCEGKRSIYGNLSEDNITIINALAYYKEGTKKRLTAV